MKILPQIDTHSPMFTAALIIIAKTWKQPQCLSAAVYGRVSKENVIYTSSVILLSHKKRIKSCHLKQHGVLSGHYTKWNKSERKTNTMWSHSGGIWKNKTQTKKLLQRMYQWFRGRGGGGNVKVIKRYKFSVIR